jgi:hypothetical protein
MTESIFDHPDLEWALEATARDFGISAGELQRRLALEPFENPKFRAIVEVDGKTFGEFAELLERCSDIQGNRRPT